MRPNVGGHFHPRGDLETAVLDRIEKIYRELQVMEPWFEGAKNLTEIAIVYGGNLSVIVWDKSLRGAIRMLCELKQQFDVVTEFSDWSAYEVLVFADDVIFNAEMARRVKAHLAAGKAVISSGISGMNHEKTEFALEQEWGIKFERECDFDPAYFAMGKNFNHKLPEMPLSLYASGIEVGALPGTGVEAFLIKPYYNRHWDGEHAFFYNPPDKVTGKPALTLCAKVAHFSHRIFAGYNRQASVELRQAFANVLNRFLPEPLLKTENLPSFARAFVTAQPGRRIVHLLSYVPELRGEKTEMIEDAAAVVDSKIALKLAGPPPRNVSLTPTGKALPFEVQEGYVHLNIPVFKGYAMLVFES
jgi:hypothetical protein